MQKRRIILVSDSRLLRELFQSAIQKSEQLEITQEIHDPNELPLIIELFNADWVIMSLAVDEDIPKWVNIYIGNHPHVRFLFISDDNGKIMMRWLEPREKYLNDLSLSDLIHILEKNPQQPITLHEGHL
jgi:DNA-binding NarL/FixJ family response regulator